MTTSTFLLWPQGAPLARGANPEDCPDITVYLPTVKSTGLGVVVCPGGGYGGLADDHEGRQIAAWLNARGIAAFLLKYRLAPSYQHPAMMWDAQRALRLVRAGAPEWGYQLRKLGIWGFSAGGHLAASATTHFDTGNKEASDPIDQQSCRPDFAILAYPVITMTEPFTHKGSQVSLLGEKPSQELIDLMSNEKQVTNQTPPTFLFHTTDDTAVPVENSLLFYQALRNANVPVDMHLYAHGSHGVGLAPDDPILSYWPEALALWLKNM